MRETMLTRDDVNSMCFSPEGVLYTTHKNTIKVWKPKLSGTNTPETTIALAKPAHLTHLALNPYNPEILLCCSLYAAHILHLPSGTVTDSIHTRSKIQDCVFSPRESRFALGLEDGSVQVYDASTLTLLHAIEPYYSDAVVTRLAYSPNGAYLTVAITSRTKNKVSFVSKYNAHGVTDTRLSLPQHNHIPDMAYAPGQQLWVLSGQKNTIIFSPSGSYKELSLAETIGNAKHATALAWLPEKNQMVIASEKGLYFYNIAGEKENTLLTATGEVTRILPSPSGDYVAYLKRNTCFVLNIKNPTSLGYNRTLG